MTYLRTLILSAVAALGFTCVFAANDSTSTTTPTQSTQGSGHHWRGGRMHSPFIRVVQQLNLNDDQKQRISSLIKAQHDARRANADSQRANGEALANPGDPNYAAAVSAAKTAAATAIQDRSNLEVQIYGVLTPDQQAQLPKVLADMKTRAEQHRAQWEQHNSKQTG
jgi:Spy/CpxP family protein refolding chaperone